MRALEERKRECNSERILRRIAVKNNNNSVRCVSRATGCFGKNGDREREINTRKKAKKIVYIFFGGGFGYLLLFFEIVASEPLGTMEMSLLLLHPHALQALLHDNDERRDKAVTAAAKTTATAKETTAAAAKATAAQNKRKREQRGSKGPNAVHDKLNGLHGLSLLYGPRATATAAAAVGCVLRAARRCDWR